MADEDKPVDCRLVAEDIRFVELDDLVDRILGSVHIVDVVAGRTEVAVGCRE